MTGRASSLVLFSGGQDSATCLAWALERYTRVETIGFDYGQRHAVELQCRDQLRAKFAAFRPEWTARLGSDHMVKIDALAGLSTTALTQEMAIEMGESGLPNTFVPGRNLLFLTFAAALAYRRGIEVLVAGVCETDYSGYPDCRDDTMKAMQLALNLGMERRFVVETPLMWIDKAATFRLAREIGGEELLSIVIEDSHSCYLGNRERRHEWGYGCGTCPACGLRAQGYERFRCEESAAN